jgi:acetyltransferase-like isoleucine patch superfamily enzyme
MPRPGTRLRRARSRLGVLLLRASPRLAGRLAAWRERNEPKPTMTIGESTYGRPEHIVLGGDVSNLAVGRFCSIAAGVKVFAGGGHRTDWVSTFPFRVVYRMPGQNKDGHPPPARDTIIGNDVWIGHGATVLAGVHVGDGAVIGAEAVVASNVRPYAIVVGNPAREIRRRFDDGTVERLLRIRWWDWPLDIVISRIPHLSNADVQAFVDQFDPPTQRDDPQSTSTS